MNPIVWLLLWLDHLTPEWLWKPLNAAINKIWPPGPPHRYNDKGTE